MIIHDKWCWDLSKFLFFFVFCFVKSKDSLLYIAFILEMMLFNAVTKHIFKDGSE